MNSDTISPFLKVITVDDSPLIAERIESILKEINNLTYLGNAFTISSAKHLVNTVKPDVAILDIHIDHAEDSQTGIDLLAEFRQNYPQMMIIIFTNHNELHYRFACLEKGADYFLDKSNDSLKISEILQQWTSAK